MCNKEWPASTSNCRSGGYYVVEACCWNALLKRAGRVREAGRSVAHVLIMYSTVDGQTRRICERVSHRVEAGGHSVTLLSLAEHENLDITPFEPVIVGASVRYGHHRKAVSRFIQRNAALLSEKQGALFSVNLVARDPARRRPGNNPYLEKLLRQVSWRPDVLRVFAGRLDYPRYKLWDRLIIKLIMKMTGGPTDVDTVEFTDWGEVDAFGDAMADIAGRCVQ